MARIQDIQTRVVATLYALVAEAGCLFISEHPCEGLARHGYAARSSASPSGPPAVPRLDGKAYDIPHS